MYQMQINYFRELVCGISAVRECPFVPCVVTPLVAVVAVYLGYGSNIFPLTRLVTTCNCD